MITNNLALRHGAPSFADRLGGNRLRRTRVPVPPPHRGFTLVELVATIVIAAILIAIAVPNMRMFVEKNRVKLAVGELATTLNFARSEATKRRFPITVCARASDSSCTAGGTSWNGGWLVFADADGNGAIDAGNEILRITSSLPQNVTLESKGFTTPAIMQYSSAGELSVNGKFKICNSEPGYENIARAIDISATGRASVDPATYTCSAI